MGLILASILILSLLFEKWGSDLTVIQGRLVKHQASKHVFKEENNMSVEFHLHSSFYCHLFSGIAHFEIPSIQIHSKILILAQLGGIFQILLYTFCGQNIGIFTFIKLNTCHAFRHALEALILANTRFYTFEFIR